MISELDAATEEYMATRDEFETTRIKFEAAKERFAGVRRLANGVLSERDWNRWQSAHSSVQFVGIKIGDAIERALALRAFAAAEAHFDSNRRLAYQPGMTVDQIQEVLEQGGFEFRTSTPRREVHAALINLEAAKKKGALYISGQAQEILLMMAPPEHGEPEPELEREEIEPDLAKVQDDEDEVPF